LAGKRQLKKNIKPAGISTDLIHTYGKFREEAS
jgi:hypothetical protein